MRLVDMSSWRFLELGAGGVGCLVYTVLAWVALALGRKTRRLSPASRGRSLSYSGRKRCSGGVLLCLAVTPVTGPFQRHAQTMIDQTIHQLVNSLPFSFFHRSATRA